MPAAWFVLRKPLTCICLQTMTVLVAAVPAVAGGAAENVLLLMDPSDKESLYIGNYYQAARGIPAENVLYLAPGATNFTTFVDFNRDAVFGELANRTIEDQIDFIVVTPGTSFYVDAPGLVTDPCSPVRRFSASSVYTMAFIANEVLAGTLDVTNPNRYYSTSTEARAFDSSVKWLGGVPSNNAFARRYFIGAMLGYTGERGNTLAEIIRSIDLSVAADGSRPAGTFYFMNNAADPARNVREPQYNAIISLIKFAGGNAERLDGVLPDKQDCLGIMTGAASPNIAGSSLALLPGAFGDHLTSWAATFDKTSQTKVSAWLAKGASGSWGAVEEPCNYTGKFPHARAHYYYYQGLALGEAVFRSLEYTPFQGLLYGDPLTRAFAYLPMVEVSDAPTGPVQGEIRLTPTATTNHPTAQIAGFDLLIDGVLADSIAPGGQFVVDTRSLPDGYHDLRVLAYDDTLVKSTGRWLGELTVSNAGRSVSLDVLATTGNWATPFEFDVLAVAEDVREVRIVQNGRVVAAAPGATTSLVVHGLILGSGPVQVYAEALRQTGQVLRSAPVTLDIDFLAGMPSGQPPVAYSYVTNVLKEEPFLVELPATFDDDAIDLTYELVEPLPTKVDIVGATTGPYRLLRPKAGAMGTDTLSFIVRSGLGDSNVATVTLELGVLRGDLSCDELISFADINPFILIQSNPSQWQGQYPDCPIDNGDINANGAVGFDDINPFVALLAGN